LKFLEFKEKHFDLPFSDEEFEDFAATIFDTFDLPDEPLYRHNIATMIMHLGPTVYQMPLSYFAAGIKRQMAGNVAYDAIKRIKKELADKEKDEFKETELISATTSN